MKLVFKTIEYLLYALVFFLPFQTRWIVRKFETGPAGAGRGFVEYLSVSMYVVDILLIFLVALFAILFFKNFNKLIEAKISKMQCIIAGFDFFVFVSIFFASDRNLAISKYVFLILSIFIIALFTKVNYNSKKMYFIFFSSIFLQSILAIWQFIMQETFASKWLGIAKHNSFSLDSSVIETIGNLGISERWLRAYGSFDHPNILGAVLVIAILLLLDNFLKHKRQESTKTDWKLIAYYVLFVFYFTALVFSFSRSAAIALTVSFLFIFIIFLLRKDLLAEARVLKVSFIFVIIAFVSIIIYPNLFITRAGGQTRLENKSITERNYYFDESKEIIKNNFLFGVGIGNYSLEAITERENDYFWTYQPVHNTFMLIIAEIGIFGFLFFISFLLFIIKQSVEKKKFFNIAIIIALFIIMLFDHWVWSLHFGVLFFWFVMGILLKNLEKEEIINNECIDN